MMKDVAVKIGQSTAITIPVFMSLAGFIYWLSSMYAATTRNSNDIAALSYKVDELNHLSDRITRIEAKLDLIYHLEIDGKPQKH
jgi:hypothetical protein